MNEWSFDVIMSIRELRSRIQSPFRPTRVAGHRDDTTPIEQLSRLERLNVECDYIAKYARKHMQPHKALMPTLSLPYERLALYHHEEKIYKDYHTIMLEKSHERSARTYYCRKYAWTEDQFSQVNWNTIDSAMKRCTPSTANQDLLAQLKAWPVVNIG